MKRPIVALALAVLITGPAIALGHNDGYSSPTDGGLSPLHEGAYEHQHGQNTGHLPAIKKNVEVIGRVDVTELLGTENPGRVSDVAGFGNYAYLGAFYQPDCAEPGGVFVIDISTPSAPKKVGFIPADPYTYVGEGVQVLDMSTPAFQGQILIHNNESCIPVAGPTGSTTLIGGGTSIWDVTDPLMPKPLALHFGEGTNNTPTTTAAVHQSHSSFGWQQEGKAYVVAVDNDESGRTDLDFFDITDPANPTLVVETGMNDFPGIREFPRPNGNNAFIHDMVVKKIGDRYVLLGSYWDGGYLTLDVTDLPSKPTLLGHTDFGAVEPFATQMGLPSNWTPEGNAHQAEFSYKNDLFLGADEDFSPRRLSGTIRSGRYAGDRFSARDGNLVPPFAEMGETQTRFVGQACEPLVPAPSPNEIALVERGVCTFSVKLTNVTAAGYKAGLVFNDRATDPDCESFVFMLAVGQIPFAFVARSTGLKLLDVEFTLGDPCKTDTPPVDLLNPARETLTIEPPVFDGWGYLHLYDANTMQALGHWALPETIDPAHATGSGVLSIHEVATDPRRNRAYISHYSGGFRVVRFSREDGIREIGAFIPEGGANMWGVEVHYMPDSEEPFVLASDRDSGLWILRYKKDKGHTP